MPRLNFLATKIVDRRIIYTNIITAFVLIGSSAAMAEDVTVDNAVLIERVSLDRWGKKHLVLEPAQQFRPGDRLIYVLTYRNTGAAKTGKLILTNPIPATVSFLGTTDGQEMVSVDGGKNWGTLTTLKVENRDGTMRAASPEDVTHIRWQNIDRPTGGQTGKLAFRAVVRRLERN